MIALIEDNLESIRALCARYDVRSLTLFGSATSVRRFDPARSDVDFLVDLGDYDGSVLDRFLGLAEGLEQVLGRNVDLVIESTLSNPYLIASIKKAKVSVYEAEHRKAAA